MTRKEQLLLLVFTVAIGLGAAALFFHDRRPKNEATETVVVPGPRRQIAPVAATTPPRPQPLPPAPEEAIPTTPTAPATETTALITVVARGAVRRPGIYTLAPGARVQDLIEAAGGQREEADLSDINLAAKIIDGSTLTLPSAGTAIVEGRRIELRAGQSAAALNPPEYTLSGWRPTAATPPPAQEKNTAPPSAGQTAGPVNLNTASAEQLDTLPGVGPVTAKKIIEYRSKSPFISVDDLINVHGIGEKKLEDIRPFATVQ